MTWICDSKHGLPYNACTNKDVSKCRRNDLEAALLSLKDLPEPPVARREFLRGAIAAIEEQLAKS